MLFSPDGIPFSAFFEPNAPSAIADPFKDLFENHGGRVANTPEAANVIIIFHQSSIVSESLIAHFSVPFSPDNGSLCTMGVAILDYSWILACIRASQVLGPPTFGGHHTKPVTFTSFLGPAATQPVAHTSLELGQYADGPLCYSMSPGQSMPAIPFHTSPHFTYVQGADYQLRGRGNSSPLTPPEILPFHHADGMASSGYYPYHASARHPSLLFGRDSDAFTLPDNRNASRDYTSPSNAHVDRIMWARRPTAGISLGNEPTWERPSGDIYGPEECGPMSLFLDDNPQPSFQSNPSSHTERQRAQTNHLITYPNCLSVSSLVDHHRPQYDLLEAAAVYSLDNYTQSSSGPIITTVPPPVPNAPLPSVRDILSFSKPLSQAINSFMSRTRTKYAKHHVCDAIIFIADNPCLIMKKGPWYPDPPIGIPPTRKALWEQFAAQKYPGLRTTKAWQFFHTRYRVSLDEMAIQLIEERETGNTATRVSDPDDGSSQVLPSATGHYLGDSEVSPVSSYHATMADSQDSSSGDSRASSSTIPATTVAESTSHAHTPTSHSSVTVKRTTVEWLEAEYPPHKRFKNQ